MRIIVDLNQHQAVADFGVQSPPAPFEFKSQDTIDFQIYFVADGIVQDMGAGFVLKFGMIKTGDTTNTIIAYQTVSSYLTDVNSNVYYQMQVVMNTSQMATAIGTANQINCTIEIRYQDTLAEIIHSLDISAIVFKTILVETGTTPPNVSTGYPDASTIELLVHKSQPNGYAGLDSSGHILSSQLAGMAELVAHKNQPSGYAGLDSGSLIPVAEIPIDGTTIVVISGKIAAPLAGGDMQKSVYDTNNDGIVDQAYAATNATAAITATTAATLAVAPALGSLSTVWGKDAAGHQGLFPAPTGGGGGGGTPAPDAISGIIAAPVNKAYTYEIYAPSNYTITDIWAGTSAGTCTIALSSNGGGNIAGTSLNVTATAPSSFPPHVGGLSISAFAGDTWQLVVSAVSGAVDLAFSILIQRSVASLSVPPAGRKVNIT